MNDDVLYHCIYMDWIYVIFLWIYNIYDDLHIIHLWVGSYGIIPRGLTVLSKQSSTLHDLSHPLSLRRMKHHSATQEAEL